MNKFIYFILVALLGSQSNFVYAQQDVAHNRYFSNLIKTLSLNPDIKNIRFVRKTSLNDSFSVKALYVNYKDDSINRYWQIGKDYIYIHPQHVTNLKYNPKRDISWDTYSQYLTDSSLVLLDIYESLKDSIISIKNRRKEILYGFLSDKFESNHTVYKTLEYVKDSLLEKTYDYSIKNGFVLRANSVMSYCKLTDSKEGHSQTKIIKTPNSNDKKQLLIDKRDGHKYPIIQIGNQIWMSTNLSYKPDSGKFWTFKDSLQNANKYGYLYSWETAKKVCPAGWHLPTKSDFDLLVKEAGGNDDESTYKALSSSDFAIRDIGMRHLFGFSSTDGTSFWSSSENTDKKTSWALGIRRSTMLGQKITNLNTSDKRCGYFVRCTADK